MKNSIKGKSAFFILGLKGLKEMAKLA